VTVGEQVTIQATLKPGRYTVAGIAAPAQGDLSQQASIFFNSGEARRLAGRDDNVAVIGVFPDTGTSLTTLRANLASALDDTTATVHAGADRGAIEFLDAASARTQLVSLGGAMAGIATLVALLVIIGTFALTIQQRHREIALFRAVAATPRQARQLISREATALALTAALLGAVAGIPLAGGLRALFEHFGGLPSTLHLAYSPVPCIAAVLLSIVAAWLAARVSARRITRIRPADALADAALPSRLVQPSRTAVGIVAVVGGVVLLWVLTKLHTEPAAQPVTFLTVITWAAAVALLGPVLVRLASILVAVILRALGVSGYLATANTSTSAKRFASVLSPVCLGVALACTVLFTPTTMAAATDAEAAEGTLADHVLVSDGPGVPSAAAEQVRDTAGVHSVTEILRSNVRINLHRYSVFAVTGRDVNEAVDPDVIAGELRDLQIHDVAVSTTAANSLDITVGDTLDVVLGDGTPQALTVVALYGRGLGFADLIVDRDLVAGHVDNPLNQAVLIDLDDPNDSAATDGIRKIAADYPTVNLRPASKSGTSWNRPGQPGSHVNLIALALIVAFTIIAAVNTLAISTRERAREFTLLRLLGGTRRQIRTMLVLETGLITAFGIVLGTAIAGAVLTGFSRGVAGAAHVEVPPTTYGLVAVSALVLSVIAVLGAGRSVIRTELGHAVIET